MRSRRSRTRRSQLPIATAWAHPLLIEPTIIHKLCTMEDAAGPHLLTLPPEILNQIVSLLNRKAKLSLWRTSHSTQQLVLQAAKVVRVEIAPHLDDNQAAAAAHILAKAAATSGGRFHLRITGNCSAAFIQSCAQHGAPQGLAAVSSLALEVGLHLMHVMHGTRQRLLVCPCTPRPPTCLYDASRASTCLPPASPASASALTCVPDLPLILLCRESL